MWARTGGVQRLPRAGACETTGGLHGGRILRLLPFVDTPLQVRRALLSSAVSTCESFSRTYFFLGMVSCRDRIVDCGSDSLLGMIELAASGAFPSVRTSSSSEFSETTVAADSYLVELGLTDMAGRVVGCLGLVSRVAVDSVGTGGEGAIPASLSDTSHPSHRHGTNGNVIVRRLATFTCL
jgi:hypothetical protein